MKPVKSSSTQRNDTLVAYCSSLRSMVALGRVIPKDGSVRQCSKCATDVLVSKIVIDSTKELKKMHFVCNECVRKYNIPLLGIPRIKE